MVDDGGDNIFRRTPTARPDAGLVPTGEDAVEEGESVFVAEDDELAGGYVPDTDEIVQMSEEHCAGHHPDEELPPETPERQETPDVSGKPPMQDIE